MQEIAIVLLHATVNAKKTAIADVAMMVLKKKNALVVMEIANVQMIALAKK